MGEGGGFLDPATIWMGKGGGFLDPPTIYMGEGGNFSQKIKSEEDGWVNNSLHWNELKIEEHWLVGKCVMEALTLYIPH